MTDKQILDEVYRLMTQSNVPLSNIQECIEREWQRQDEKDAYADTTFSKHWYTDVRDMERHRGLEIGPDGTVKDLK